MKMRDRAEKRLRMRHFRPSRPISFEIAQSARQLARKYRLEQHIPNETLDFAVKCRFVFRYETVVFRRYVLALLSEVNSLGAFHVFKNSSIFVICFPVSPRELVTCAIVFQLGQNEIDLQKIIKQLLNEVEHDIMNYQNRGLCYLPKPKAEADNTDTRF